MKLWGGPVAQQANGQLAGYRPMTQNALPKEDLQSIHGPVHDTKPESRLRGGKGSHCGCTKSYEELPN